MKHYRFSSNGRGVIRLPDGLFVSFDDADPNKPEFSEWLANGDVPLPAEFTLDELQAKNADAPIQPLSRALEWFEDSRVGLPQLADGVWTRPMKAIDLRAPENFGVLKDRMIDRLATVRWEHETAGATLNGVPLDTDDKAQFKITGAYARATRYPDATVSWKAPEGFVILGADEIFAVGDAVFDHVQRCFDRERGFRELIDASETIEDLMSIDINEGWSA